MVAPLDREHLLAAVERSPRAAAAHDRAAWVGLFTADGRIEDPVGSRPHAGIPEIGRFYDTFIRPRDITFHRDFDVVFGTVVLRDLELEVSMGSAVTMYIPAFLRYDLREANGEWRFAELRAYWELPAMMLQFLRTGPGAITPGLRLSRDLLTIQRLRGTAGFMSGFRRVGARHKRLMQAFVDALARRDTAEASHALSPTAPITLGDSGPLDIAKLAQQLSGARPEKVIASGATVTVSLNSDHGRGLLFADVPWRGEAITRVRYFPA
ncbi:transporter [Mycobacterium rhizamassiliense]|uniref:Transporter n=1 Tax=Mycobacterium rhizamassiliense TaxID=1841860 RepID=A0A2U3NY71_9MYCO|nr:ketosteroid isomerase family protein [Mycobacterium rhizamassiliense]SPM36444.1 transporter [Mycobacterium rhizamassiliense]